MYNYRRYDRPQATITGNGVWVMEVVVPAGASSAAAIQAIPGLSVVQLDTNGFANRTISVSKKCGDFSAASSVIVSQNFPEGRASLITSNDAIRVAQFNAGALPNAAVVNPGETWYINVRNNDCTSSGYSTCNFAYTWANWGGSGVY
jgi:hypothetical protein